MGVSKGHQLSTFKINVGCYIEIIYGWQWRHMRMHKTLTPKFDVNTTLLQCGSKK